MYKFIGAGLLALFALMVIPVNFDSSDNDYKMYGTALVVAHDAYGQEIMSQQIHNRLVNSGEDFILSQTFKDTVNPVADINTIGAICVTSVTGLTLAETSTAASFNPAAGFTDTGSNPCRPVNPTTPAQGQRALTFTFTGNTEFDGGETITAVAICEYNNNAPYGTCATSTNGVLFAGLDIADVTVATSSTIAVTYTFDITSPSS